MKENRTEKLTFRVSPKLKAELETRADELSISTTALVLNYLSKGLANDRAMEKLVTPDAIGEFIKKSDIFGAFVSKQLDLVEKAK